MSKMHFGAPKLCHKSAFPTYIRQSLEATIAHHPLSQHTWHVCVLLALVTVELTHSLLCNIWACSLIDRDPQSGLQLNIYITMFTVAILARHNTRNIPLHQLVLTEGLLEARAGTLTTELLGLGTARVSHEQGSVVLDERLLDVPLGGLLNVPERG
jgi:hypothetical protein